MDKELIFLEKNKTSQIFFTKFLILLCVFGWGLFSFHNVSASTFYVTGGGGTTTFLANIDKSSYAPTDVIYASASISTDAPNVDRVYIQGSVNGGAYVDIIGTTAIYQNQTLSTPASPINIGSAGAPGSYTASYRGGVRTVPSFNMPYSCTIPLGNNSCTIGYGWSFMYVSPGAKITQDGVGTVATYVAGGPDSGTLTVVYPSALFRLLDSAGTEKGNRTVSAVCTSGTVWGGVINGCVVAPTSSLSASPTSVSSGGSSTLTWSSNDATSCTGYNFSTGTDSPTSGSVTINPTVTNIYRVFCANAGASSQASTRVTVQ